MYLSLPYFGLLIFFSGVGVLFGQAMDKPLSDYTYYVDHCKAQRILASEGKSEIDKRCQSLLFPAEPIPGKPQRRDQI